MIEKHLTRHVRMIVPVAITLPFILAGDGLLDLCRGAPGAPIALALPLRETGHADGVSWLALIAVWLLTFALASLVSPATRSRVVTLASLRAGLTLGILMVVQAISVQLVRQATFGFDWATAASSPSVYIAAACAFVATLAFARVHAARTVTLSSDRRGKGGGANGPSDGQRANVARATIST